MVRKLSKELIDTEVCRGSKDVRRIVNHLEFLKNYSEGKELLAEYKSLFKSEKQKGIYPCESSDYYYTSILGFIDLITPEGTYFGAHQDDPDSVGFWKINRE